MTKSSAQIDETVTNHSILLHPLSSGSYSVQAVSIHDCGDLVRSEIVTIELDPDDPSDDKSDDAADMFDPDASEEQQQEAFASAMDRALDLLRKYSNAVSLQDMKMALQKQMVSLQDFLQFIPGPALGGEPKVEAADTSAKILWTTDEEATGIVEYSEAALFTEGNYVFNVGKNDLFGTEHEVTLVGLKPGTRYHFRVRSATPYGTETVSRDFTFATRQESIVIQSYSIDIESTEQVTFRWTTNVDTDTRLTITPYRSGELRAVDAFTLKTDALATTHVLSYDRFEAGTYYDVEMAGKDSAGNITSKVIARFSTSDEDLPPQILTVRTDAAIVPGKDSRIQTVISWDTNEQSTGRVYYQKGINTDPTATFSQSTPLNANYTREHVVLLPSLEPGEVYSFQIESMDSQGNLTRTKTYTLLTPKEKEGVLQVIIKQMEETFGWVGNMRR